MSHTCTPPPTHTTHASVPPAVHKTTLTLGYHQLGDFYAPNWTLCSVQDLCTRAPRQQSVQALRDQSQADTMDLQLLLQVPTSRWH